MRQVITLILFIISVNALAIEIDACIDGKDTTIKVDTRTNPYRNCTINVEENYLQQKDYSGLYYIDGRDYPLAYTVIASNHVYSDIIQGAKRDNASICHLFEQIKNEGHDLTKLVSANESVRVLVGGSEYNSFLYDFNPTVQIDMNNADYCSMKEKIIEYIKSK